MSKKTIMYLVTTKIPEKEYKTKRIRTKKLNIKEIKTPKRIVVTVGLLERLNNITNEWIQRGIARSESEAIRKILDYVLTLLEKEKEESGSYKFPEKKMEGY